jgi:hypothetical protein
MFGLPIATCAKAYRYLAVARIGEPTTPIEDATLDRDVGALWERQCQGQPRSAGQRQKDNSTNNLGSRWLGDLDPQNSLAIRSKPAFELPEWAKSITPECHSARLGWGLVCATSSGPACSLETAIGGIVASPAG